MEQKITLEEVRSLFGENFVGPEEIELIAMDMLVQPPSKLKEDVPAIPFSKEELEVKSKSHILILLVPVGADGKALTILSFRNFFGVDPSQAEPCFYNQDWYIHERFANSTTINFEWCLISKEVIEDSKGKTESFFATKKLPTALCCVYTFFAYYFLTKKVLWSKNFVWCVDTDANGDRIYVGRYYDPIGIAKNGFSIHRHLKITPVYGCVDLV